MIANLVSLGDTIEAYLKRVSAGLTGMSEPQQQEIIAEIRSHLAERVQQFAEEGSLQPDNAAIAAMGEADELARQFARTVNEQRASRSFAPWVLLRIAAGIAFSGAKGLLTFLLGLAGYGTALAFTGAALLRVLMPSRVGFWIGPHVFVWGAAPMSDGRELAGNYFIPVSVALAFLFASGTTLALRWLTRRGLSRVLRRAR